MPLYTPSRSSTSTTISIRSPAVKVTMGLPGAGASASPMPTLCMSRPLIHSRQREKISVSSSA